MLIMRRVIIYALLMLLTNSTLLPAQESADSVRHRFVSDLTYTIEANGSLGSGDHSPLWLHSNRYGLNSSETNSGYLRAGLFREASADSLYRWRYGYGLDLQLAANHNSTFFVHQAYAELEWLDGRITVGSKERPMEMKNNRLSSGSMALGINARPIPQVRVELADYWPRTHGWVHVKGHIAYGMATDQNWQHDFTHRQGKYVDRMLYHSKAGFIKIGRNDKPLSLEMGLEMACQFGGTSHTGNRTIKNSTSLKSFWHALYPGGSDAQEATGGWENIEGNHLGAWMARLNYNAPNWSVGIYTDHYFEDRSGFKHRVNIGYGEGDEWNVKKKKHYLLYDFRDMLLGVDLRLKKGTWLKALTLEYNYTKYQSGPIHHMHNSVFPDRLGGGDNYYNHGTFTGWQHWGEGIGNPLIYSPLYNDNGSINFYNNRIIAYHAGIEGQPCPSFGYRMLASWEQGWGTYSQPYTHVKRQFSFLGECSYSPQHGALKGWSGTLGIGVDSGHIIGDNFGCSLTVRKCGSLTGGKKRSK